MQADVEAAQAKYDEAHNRVIELQAKLKEAYDNGDYATAQQLRSEIMMADSRERSCEYELAHYRSRLESQKGHVQYFESAAEEAKASVDESIAKRNALTDDLEKARAAYDDACKAYEEAKATADKATSPEITKPTETTPPSGSAQPAETAQPAGSPAAGKDAAPSSAKQANTSNGKQATTTADKLANTGDTTPSAIALAGIAAAGLGIATTATRRLKNSK
ncbi:MAG: LPXTG cell wall anchor domain-containing protein [Collinsella sp.]